MGHYTSSVGILRVWPEVGHGDAVTGLAIGGIGDTELVELVCEVIPQTSGHGGDEDVLGFNVEIVTLEDVVRVSQGLADRIGLVRVGLVESLHSVVRHDSGVSTGDAEGRHSGD